MNLGEKAENLGEDLMGKAKEATGKVTGDQELEAEGRMDQVAAEVKDKASELADKAKDIAGGLGANVKAAADKLKEGFSN